jgi:diguanylate cyclase (GGDEF)-like protein
LQQTVIFRFENFFSNRVSSVSSNKTFPDFMSDSQLKFLSENNPKSLKKSYMTLAAASLCALFLTFVISNSNFKFETKLFTFISLVLSYLLFCSAAFLRQKRETENFQQPFGFNKSIITDDVETKLLALEEANQFFSASLKSADMFRLVASRVREIVPFAVFVLFLASEDKKNLKIVYAEGENAKKFIGIETSFGQGLAGKVFQTLDAEFDEQLRFDKGVIAAEILRNLKSAIAAPLSGNNQAFGVLQLFGSAENPLSLDSLKLLEAVASRVEPLFLSSLAVEENLTNALTDSLTNLPNERAFFLVLENQIAESQRFRDERPLNVLTIDIQDFDELNRRFGHATGDRILKYVAVNIKTQLRQMDFLARAAGDEFLAVLPTASENVTQEIIERIKKAFVSKPFAATAQEKINLQLNFGSASFWKHGETAEKLLENARLRKLQSKSAENSNVLWFPKEYVN